jgi:hypothetical protein
LKRYDENFKVMALDAKIPSFVPLSELKNYNVTLNTMNYREYSVLNSGISFGTYDKKKLLRFYVHDMQAINSTEEVDNQKNIVFCLLRGNLMEREQSLDISNMRFE